MTDKETAKGPSGSRAETEGAGSAPPDRKARAATDRLVMALIGGTTTLGVYPSSHPQSEEAVSRLRATLYEALQANRSEDISVLAIDEDLAVDGQPWKRTVPMRSSLVRAFRRCGIDRITLGGGCEPAELQALLRGLSGRQGLEESRHVTLGQIRLADDDTSSDRAKASLENRYDQVMDWLHAFERDAAASYQELDRAVWELLDAVEASERDFLLRASRKDDLDRLFHHSIQVCLVATEIARALDIRGSALHDIALGALLHDVGYLDLPRELVWRKRSLEPAEERTVRLHTELGAIRLAALDGVPPLCLIAAREHHLAWDGANGYPQADGRRPHLIARITAVADHWDALSSAAGKLAPAARHELAKNGLSARAGNQLDPDLVAVLVD